MVTVQVGSQNQDPLLKESWQEKQPLRGKTLEQDRWSPGPGVSWPGGLLLMERWLKER